MTRQNISTMIVMAAVVLILPALLADNIFSLERPGDSGKEVAMDTYTALPVPDGHERATFALG
ncbi:hypothetical protein ACFL4R_00670 [Nitrospirota bacterium]